MTTKIQPEYEKLGIHPDTMTCVAILPKSEAKDYVFALAANGVGCEAHPSTDPKVWHVAVKGGLAYNPAAYFASITGDDRSKPCTVDARQQHPLAVSEEERGR